MTETTTSPGIEAAAAAWIARHDAGLTADEQAEFERWKTQDVRNGSAWERHERAWRRCDRPRALGKADQVLSRLNALAVRRRRRRLGTVAAALLLVVGFGLVWRQGHVAAFPPALSEPVAHAVVVLPETRTLPDGSVVLLRAGAEIAVDFSGPLRRVSLRKGEAHFHVAKNAARPFIVEAAGVEVKAVGTAFAVQLGAGQVEVFVTEGKIAVAQSVESGVVASDNRPAPAAPEPTFAVAGSHVVVGLAGLGDSATRPKVTAIGASELAERLEWRGARLEFTGTTLADAVQLMNRYNRVRLVIDPADAGLADLQVSGYFRAENIDTFLHLIEQSLEVKTERSGDTVTLRKAR